MDPAFIVLMLGIVGTAWGASSIALYWMASDHACSADYSQPGFRPYEVKGPPD